MSAKPHVEQVTNYKLTPDRAERSGLIRAQRWIVSMATADFAVCSSNEPAVHRIS